MDNDEKVEILASLMPKGWEVNPNSEGAEVVSKNGKKKQLLLQDSSVVIDGKSFTYKVFEYSASLIVSFILQCFDGKIRL